MTKYYLLYKNSLGFNLAKFLEREQAEETGSIWLKDKKITGFKVLSEKEMIEVMAI